MDQTRLTDLMLTGRYHRRNKGQAIESYGDTPTVTMVREGYVKRFLITADGSESLQSIFGPGYLFPLTNALLAMLDQSIYHGDETYFYEAMSDAQVYTIDASALAAAAEADPLLYKDVLYEAGRRLLSNIQQVENISLKTAPRRIAHQLVFLANEFGQATPQGTQLLVPMTHQNIGEMLNLNRETVTRAITKLRSLGLILEDKHIIIPDIDKLKEFYEL